MSEIRARDLRSAELTITFKGEKRRMVFDNYAYAAAEDIYQEEYGRDEGIYKILADMAHGRTRGIFAIAYGALKSGGLKNLTFRDFMEHFSIAEMEKLNHDMRTGVMNSMPPVEPGKNA